MLIIAAQLDSFRSLKDKTLKLSFETSEPTPDDLHELALMNGAYGYLAFKKEPFKEDEKELLTNLKTDFEEFGKTPSQRLRGVMYKCWEQYPEGYKVFEDFYKSKMEQMINHFKSKL